MTQLLVRNIAHDTLECLKNRAKQHHRSLQGEIISILNEAANASEIRKASWSPEIIKQIVGGWQGEPLTCGVQDDYEKRDELE